MFTDNAYTGTAYVEYLICLLAELDLDQQSRFYYQKPVTSKFSILNSNHVDCHVWRAVLEDDLRQTQGNAADDLVQPARDQ